MLENEADYRNILRCKITVYYQFFGFTRVEDKFFINFGGIGQNSKKLHMVGAVRLS